MSSSDDQAARNAAILLFSERFGQVQTYPDQFKLSKKENEVINDCRYKAKRDVGIASVASGTLAYLAVRMNPYFMNPASNARFLRIPLVLSTITISASFALSNRGQQCFDRLITLPDQESPIAKEARERIRSIAPPESLFRRFVEEKTNQNTKEAMEKGDIEVINDIAAVMDNSNGGNKDNHEEKEIKAINKNDSKDKIEQNNVNKIDIGENSITRRKTVSDYVPMDVKQENIAKIEKIWLGEDEEDMIGNANVNKPTPTTATTWEEVRRLNSRKQQ